MTHKGMVLAAPSSGSGKTTIMLALLLALKKRQIPVRSFKSGPDYIDPMFHERVLGIPSRNLDTFFSEKEQIQSLYAYGQEKFELSVIEGAMGLYDGLGGTSPRGSAYDLAQTLDLPVILILDAKGMGRTMIALLSGLLQYDRDHRIAGVILNRISEHYYQQIGPEIERELKLPVIGYFPTMKELKMDSRHLGLKLPQEVQDLRKQVEEAREQLEKTVDLNRLLEIVSGFSSGKVRERMPENQNFPVIKKSNKAGKHIRIAVAYDRAFCFYYEDNLRMLREAGAELIFFSPLEDRKLPEHTKGLLLGGGYPELFAKELSENTSMRSAIQETISAGIPSVAECGGFMYLHETMTGEDGIVRPMAGVIEGNCRNTGTLVRFGYVEIREQETHFLGGKPVRGHEFHYYDSDSNGENCVAEKPSTGVTYPCIHVGENHWWGYPHLYYPSNPAFVSHFLEIC